MITRGIAMFFGCFVLANVVAGWFTGGRFDANRWWLDFRPIPQVVGDLALCCGAVFGAVWSMRPQLGRASRRIAHFSLCILAGVSASNAIAFYVLLSRGTIRSGLAVPAPLSLLIAAALGWIAYCVWRPDSADRRKRLTPTRMSMLLLTVLLCALGVPLAQIVFFGNTDYRRPADVAIVFGARAYADGRASDALADRVKTACELYHAGLVQKLLFSGGAGDGEVHETESMRRLAMRLGVPDDAIVLDRAGTNTAATVQNSAELLAELNATRVLAVSHFYHLPRVKLEFQRAGLEVYTVPSPQGRPLVKLPLLVAREVVAVWYYYLPIRG